VLFVGDLKGLITRQAREKRQYFEEGVILDLLLQVTVALNHVHSRKILHRDIKSRNIFLAHNNQVRLGDFGICRVLESLDDEADTAIGTPAFASPEVCRLEPYNYKADIWSLGCVLYELMCLREPFPGISCRDIQKRVIRGQYPHPPRFYSPELRNLLSSMLSLSPDARPSCADILKSNIVSERIRANINKGTLTADLFSAVFVDWDAYPPVLPNKPPSATFRAEYRKVVSLVFLLQRALVSGVQRKAGWLEIHPLSCYVVLFALC